MLELLSQVIGWVYFAAWSISFYPQIYLNWKRKSTVGLSEHFVSYNLLGFLSYAIFNLAFYFDETVREQYRRRNAGKENLVQLNDVVFAVHAFVLTVVTFMQMIIYRGMEEKPFLRISLPLVISALTVAIAAFLAILSFTSVEIIITLYYLSGVKMACTLFKYIPQVYLNYSRKSTHGWSIGNVLLDFTGGTLSITQLFLDAYISSNWTGITGDFVKFLLGLSSLVFDTIFLVQHYVLYRKSDYEQMPRSGAPSSDLTDIYE